MVVHLVQLCCTQLAGATYFACCFAQRYLITAQLFCLNFERLLIVDFNYPLFVCYSLSQLMKANLLSLVVANYSIGFKVADLFNSQVYITCNSQVSILVVLFEQDLQYLLENYHGKGNFVDLNSVVVLILYYQPGLYPVFCTAPVVVVDFQYDQALQYWLDLDILVDGSLKILNFLLVAVRHFSAKTVFSYISFYNFYHQIKFSLWLVEVAFDRFVAAEEGFLCFGVHILEHFDLNIHEVISYTVN